MRIFWGRKKNLARKEIEPDEIFMDSTNLPGFERDLFEGRIESPLSSRLPYAIFIIFLVATAAVSIQLINLQIVNHDANLARAENNVLKRIRLPAQRGLIYDRHMKEIAWNSSVGRSYWKKDGLSHILGYVGYPEEILENADPRAKIGRAGAEMVYDEILKGRDGARLIEESAAGDLLSQSVEKEPEAGGSIILTIDAEMQSALFSILKSVTNERGFKAGAGVVVDVSSGEILSATSFPEFDSEILSQNSNPEEISSYFKNAAQPFFFRAFEGLYAPGSVFKPVVALAALEEKVIDPAHQILSTGSISIPNPYLADQFSVFYDWKAHGWVDMREALAVSSNVYFYTIGGGFGNQLGVGVRKIIDYAKRLGFGERVEIEFPEAAGFLPTPEWKEKNHTADPAWRIGDTYNLSIGQGMVQVTPLQMAALAVAIASEGEPEDIHLVRNFETKPAKKIGISKDSFRIVKEGMRGAARYGTASALSGLGIDMAGKTGTAELDSEKKKVNSWFIGFLPYEKPRLAIAIVLEAGSAQNLVGAVYAAREFVFWTMNHRPILADL